MVSTVTGDGICTEHGAAKIDGRHLHGHHHDQHSITNVAREVIKGKVVSDVHEVLISSLNTLLILHCIMNSLLTFRKLVFDPL